MKATDETILNWRDMARDYREACERQDKQIAEMQATINRLSEYIRSQGRCPCCEEYEECVPECTLHDDCYDEWQRMREARRVLRGDDGPA